MFIAGLLRWWYGPGFAWCAETWTRRLDATMDYFSIGLLIKTMFSLFRQDGAGGSGGPLNVRLRRFTERLISRLIGAVVRFFVLIVGLISVTVIALLAAANLLIWGMVPLLSFIGVILTISGWVPWHF